MNTVLILMFLVIYAKDVASSGNSCNDLTDYVTSGIQPPRNPFWYLKVDDLGTCMRMCVRRTPCNSMTFDIASHLCFLYRKVVGGAGIRIAAMNNLLYSNFTSIPRNIDENCYSRPCGEYQVCVPGRLANGNMGCSYTCMDVSEPVCPLPAVLTGRRTVRSVNNVTCEPGFVGGGVADCRRDFTWSAEVKPCKLAYHHTCTDNAICSSINATCYNGHCECINGYNESTRTCNPISDSMCPSLEGYLGPRTPGVNVTVSCDSGFTGGGNITCGNDFTWNNNVSCESILGYDCNNDGLCQEINAICSGGICKCSLGRSYNDTLRMCKEIYGSSCVTGAVVCNAINGVCVNGQCACHTGNVYHAPDAYCIPGTECEPIAGYYGSRTPGANATVSCEAGFTGGGDTICGNDFQWTNDVSCEPIYGHACTGDALCGTINAICSGNVCNCPPGSIYNDTLLMCTDIYASPCGSGSSDCSDINAVCVNGQCACGTGDVYSAPDTVCVQATECPPLEGYSGPRTPGVIANVSCDSGFTGGGDTTCGNDFFWTNAVSCQPIYAHACTSDSLCGEINAMCVSGTCDCPFGSYYNNTLRTCEDIYGSLCGPGDNKCGNINGVCINGQCACENGNVYNDINVSCVPATECPPLEGYSGLRTPGVTATVSCDTGYTGGGDSTCGKDFLWTNDVSCDPIFGHVCTDDGICGPIGALCIAQECACGQGYYYNSNTSLCEFDGDCSHYTIPDIPNTVIRNVTINGYEGLNFTCAELYYPRLSSPAYTMAACTAGGWDTSARVNCYTCGSPQQVSGAILLGSLLDTERQYECNATAGLRPNPAVSNGTIYCVEPPDSKDDTALWFPDDFSCYGARLDGGDTPNTGFLQLFLGSGWANIAEESSFGWEDATVACKDINPWFSNGGTFHLKYFNRLPSLVRTKKFTNIACTSYEKSLPLCVDFDRISDDSQDKAIGITCYSLNISTPGSPELAGQYDYYLQARPSDDPYAPDKTVHIGRLIVVYNGTVGTACRDQWSDSETDIVCKTLNPNWARKSDCSACGGFTGGEQGLIPLSTRFECQGTVPSFFLCSNQGWQFTGGCTDEVIIECKLI